MSEGALQQVLLPRRGPVTSLGNVPGPFQPFLKGPSQLGAVGRRGLCWMEGTSGGKAGTALGRQDPGRCTCIQASPPRGRSPRNAGKASVPTQGRRVHSPGAE